MPEWITREEAERRKKVIIDRDGGITNFNADELLAINKLVREDVNVTIPRSEANAIREKEGLVNLTEKTDVPINVVRVDEPRRVVPQTADIAPVTFDEAAISLIKAKIAPNATNTEFELMMYMARKYNLDPLLRQIWLVKFGDSPAQIYAGRDGYLEIAHRSGHFDGMKSWVEYEEDEKGVKKPVRGKCVVYRNDMQHPFETEVLFKEYTTGKNLWLTKPSIMLIKVAESVCLRKAFRVSGLYDPDEMG